MARIYLDHHATTPLDPRVFEAMKPWFLERFGNAASREHAYGREAADAVAAARAQVAALINADASEIVFDPPWDREMMSEVAKLQLGML